MSSSITGKPRVSRYEAMSVMRTMSNLSDKDEQRAFLNSYMKDNGITIPESAPGHGLLGTGE